MQERTALSKARRDKSSEKRRKTTPDTRHEDTRIRSSVLRVFIFSWKSINRYRGTCSVGFFNVNRIK